MIFPMWQSVGWLRGAVAAGTHDRQARTAQPCAGRSIGTPDFRLGLAAVGRFRTIPGDDSCSPPRSWLRYRSSLLSGKARGILHLHSKPTPGIRCRSSA
jgi:hypothetical protein